ncbi:protein-serine O-palmitoleoyltransferase porcupine [Drosophila takahashii]|uniref:protein-serine O-palmitoleoyltransferase porcupine n=1 Tax=Drosophila takahashii TaxID=29030 RepID=UPI001CF7F5A8|nr:protein-serine O-palmitoleoyltransferase porcupine [Drosophila takahashii]
MDYQYFEEESDYIDLDEEDEVETLGGGGGGGLDYRFGKAEDEEDYYLGEEELEEEELNRFGVLGLAERLLGSLQSCVEPSLLQVLQYVAPMLLLCLLCRLLCLLYSQRRRLTSLAPLHFLHFACGLVLLQFSVGYRLLLLLLLAAIGYLLLQLLRLGRRGAQILALLTVGSQFLYELLLWRRRSDWPQLRGIQMVVNMKLISLGFDLTASGQLQARIPGPLAYLGYVYSPATCALGPWVSYGCYMDCLVPRNSWLISLRRLVPNALLCVLAVILSNCVAPALSDFFGDSSHFLVMYWDALSVRSSHYFVGIMAQSLLVAADQRLDGGQESELLGPLVSRPWLIEWPRSISSLVRGWNIPMHEWLKRYIYGPIKVDGRSRGRILLAVLLTYAVSSLLHGMDLRIYLVLISLAFLAEGESLLRRQLASCLDACISANLCRGKERCRYARCPSRRGWQSLSHWLVKATNLAFTALAIFHLAYLGVVLLGDALNDETTESFLWHWQQAGYLSHYIGAGTFVIYLFIS